jgi:hypothetical protein
LLHVRDGWRNGSELALVRPPAPSFGRRRKRLRDIDLVVDLGEEVFSRRWWRGVATLSALTALVALIAPAPFEPLPSIPSERAGPAEAEQLRELAIAPLGAGSRTNGRMAANSLVEPLTEAPDRPFVDIFAKLGSGDTIARLLIRSAASA